MTEINKKTLRDSAAFRWLVMLLISGLMFATYYFQDFYSGLKELVENEYGFASEQFGRIIGLTTIANVFGMIIVGGIILDKWGIRLAGYVFGGLATLGGLVTWLTASGIIMDSNPLMGLIFGRVLFGIGLEVVCVIVMRTIVKWFKGYEVALAMGINMGFGRLGSALAIAISLDIAGGPFIAGGTLAPAAGFAASLIGLAMIMFVIYTFFDIKIDRQDKALAKLELARNPNTAAEAKADTSEDFKFNDLVKLVKNSSFVYITLLCVAFYSAVFPFIMYAPDLLVNKFGFAYSLPEEAIKSLFGSEAFFNAMVYVIVFLFALGVTLIPNNINGATNKVIARVVIIGLFAVIVYFNQEMLGFWLSNGPKTAALIPLGTIIFTPIFGSIVDKKGKAASLMMLGAFLLIIAHLSLSLGNAPIFAYVGLLSLGVAFSLVPAAMWPSVAKIVPENRLGTAYASMFTVQNWGLGLFFWGIGALLTFVNRGNIEAIQAGEATYDYTIPILILVLCGVISIFLAYKLKQADIRQGFGLEQPSNAK
jgi:MFS family permease